MGRGRPEMLNLIGIYKQEYSYENAQIKTKLGALEEYDTPTIDFFGIGDYRIPDNGFMLLGILGKMNSLL